MAGVRGKTNGRRRGIRLPEGYDLEGLDQIARFLGIAIQSAKALTHRPARANPLPTAIYLGRVICSRDAISKWQQREVARGRRRRAA